MSDLRWSVPLSNWSFRDLAAAATIPRLDFIEPMTWRRLSSLSKAALQVAHDCCAQLQSPVRMVFASRHGELERTTAILRAICAGEPVSPNAFSLSVLNAVTGIFGIARHDQSPATAVSAGVETLGYALLDAGMQHRQQPDWPVLLVYAHERADALYGAVADDARPSALALLIDAQRARGYLECALRYEPQRAQRRASGHEPGHELRYEPQRDLDAGRAGQTREGAAPMGASAGAGAYADVNSGIAGIAGMNMGVNMGVNASANADANTNPNAGTNAGTTTTTNADANAAANMAANARTNAGTDMGTDVNTNARTTSTASATNPPPARPRTQSDALYHCLVTRAGSAWQGPRHTWRWRWLASIPPAAQPAQAALPP